MNSPVNNTHANNSSVETWRITKPAITGSSGLVATQHYAASAVGAKVLSDGGNAIDAAIATSLMLGTVEPWMSGLGGGGFMLYYEAATQQTHSIDCGMQAPANLVPSDYPVIEGQDSDLFGWPSVLENRNVQGPLSIAVPGLLAGINTALNQFGTMALGDLIIPAIESAHSGLAVDWYTTLKIAAAAPGLARYQESASTYLPSGFAPAGEWGGPLPQIQLGKLKHTLEALQKNGIDDFYHGELAASVVSDAQKLGSKLTSEDLSNYTIKSGIADSHQYRDATIYTAPGLTAGPTLVDTLSHLESSKSNWTPGSAPDSNAYLSYTSALKTAYEHRLLTMGDTDDQSNPACTTHLTVTDRNGNVVSLTQTLLSVFGSKVMLPDTGILMNNGLMWFDPRPGKPNSLGAGKRPLSNMCPTIFTTANGARYALGASGGRRIMPSIAQLISFVVDYDLTVEESLHQARIDVSGSPLVSVDSTLDNETINRLAREHDINVAPNGVYPALYACPNMLMAHPDGHHQGAAYVASPWASVCAAE